MATKETYIVHAILDWCGWHNILAWRNQSGAIRPEKGGYIKMGKPGSPDIIAVKEGHFIGIEVKNEIGKQNANQKAFQEELEAAGGTYLLARSIEDVHDWFAINGYVEKRLG
jgi:hypothetical protein